MGFQSMRFSWCGGDHPETFSIEPMGVPGGSVPIPASTAPMPYGIDGEGVAGLLCRMRLEFDPERLAGHWWHGAVGT